MAEEIKIATGHNNAAGFVTFLVEPWCPQIAPGPLVIGLSGVVSENGWRSAELRWHPKVPNSIKVDALNKAGLTSGATVQSVLVTVRLPSNKDRTVYANYNATAFYDESDEFERSGSGFEITLLKLEAI
jgi:hypothetical protein